MKIVVSQILPAIKNVEESYKNQPNNYHLQHVLVVNDPKAKLLIGENEVQLRSKELIDALNERMKYDNKGATLSSVESKMNVDATYGGIVRWMDTDIIHIVYDRYGQVIIMGPGIYVDIAAIISRYVEYPEIQKVGMNF